MEVINDTQNNDLTTPTAILQTSQVAHLDTGFGFPIHNSLATLHRKEDGVELNLDTKLPEGAYTLWWVIFNNPEFCVDGCDVGDLEIPEANASVFWATGEVVGDDGMGSFSAELLEGTLPTGEDQVLFGDGLINSFSAEIHPIVRTHGPVIPGQEEVQTSTFNGGCPPEGCQDIQFALFRIDETDLSFSLEDGFVPLDGTIEHEGSVTFDVLPPEITVDFEGDDLSAGTMITDQYADIGLTISTSSESGAMLFDTNNPTGDDFDLAASDLGNVLY